MACQSFEALVAVVAGLRADAEVKVEGGGAEGTIYAAAFGAEDGPFEADGLAGVGEHVEGIWGQGGGGEDGDV